MGSFSFRFFLQAHCNVMIRHTLNILSAVASRQLSPLGSFSARFQLSFQCTFWEAESLNTQPPIGSPLPLIGRHNNITMVISTY